MSDMAFWRRIEIAADRLCGMADRLGAELTPGVGPAEALAWRGAVMRCASCREGAACDQWQATHDHADAPPLYCRNQHMLSAFAERRIAAE